MTMQVIVTLIQVITKSNNIVSIKKTYKF